MQKHTLAIFGMIVILLGIVSFLYPAMPLLSLLFLLFGAGITVYSTWFYR